MNYANAVKRKVTRSDPWGDINLQAELEIGRELSFQEKTKILQKFTPTTVLNRIKEVSSKIFHHTFIQNSFYA